MAKRKLLSVKLGGTQSNCWAVKAY